MSDDKPKAGCSGGVPIIISVIALILAGLSYRNSIITTKTQWHAQLRSALDQLAELQRESMMQAELPCSGNECLGNLSMTVAYHDQYQLVTAEAVELSSRIDDRITDTELLQLADALYNSGELDGSATFVSELLNRKPGFLLQYRATLIQAKIEFFQRKLDGGNAKIEAAIDLVDSNKSLPEIEATLLKAEANMLCANMHTAVGKLPDGKAYLEKAYDLLTPLPHTERVLNLEDSVRSRLMEIVMQQQGQKAMSFKELEEHYSKRIMAPPEDRGITPAPSILVPPRDIEKQEPAPATPPGN